MAVGALLLLLATAVMVTSWPVPPSYLMTRSFEPPFVVLDDGPLGEVGVARDVAPFCTLMMEIDCSTASGSVERPVKTD